LNVHFRGKKESFIMLTSPLIALDLSKAKLDTLANGFADDTQSLHQELVQRSY
jgi:hypothetical protein